VPVPTTTKAPTPSQILLLVFMSNPGENFQNFAAPYLTRSRAIFTQGKLGRCL